MLTVDTDPQLAALLEVLIAEVQGLRQDLRRDRRSDRTLSRTDRDQLERLLPAVGGAVGSEPFTVAEALELPAVRAVLRSMPAAQVGQLLQRARGVPIHGLVVERVGYELQCRLWRLVATTDVETCPVAPSPARDRLY